MAQKKKVPESPAGALVTMAKSIGATVGTVAGALGITSERPTVQKVAKPVKKTVVRAATPKKGTRRAVKASKTVAKKSSAPK